VRNGKIHGWGQSRLPIPLPFMTFIRVKFFLKRTESAGIATPLRSHWFKKLQQLPFKKMSG
jgi:hypothetical protein